MLDLYQIITDRIVAELEQGVIPWQKPWSGVQGAISHTTGKRYSLLNQILLGCRCGEFVTFKEAQRHTSSLTILEEKYNEKQRIIRSA